MAADLTERVAVAFEFWTLLCEEWGSGASRDVLAAYLSDKSLLEMLLQALCGSSSGDCQANRLQTSRIEDAAVAFFRQFCWAHRENSRRFAEILLGVLQPVGASSCYIHIAYSLFTFDCPFLMVYSDRHVIIGYNVFSSYYYIRTLCIVCHKAFVANCDKPFLIVLKTFLAIYNLECMLKNDM